MKALFRLGNPHKNRNYCSANHRLLPRLEAPRSSHESVSPSDFGAYCLFGSSRDFSVARRTLRPSTEGACRKEQNVSSDDFADKKAWDYGPPHVFCCFT